jgi:hypothetical protein
MEQFLIIFDGDVYMVYADHYDGALDSLAEELFVSRDVLVLECPALEIERRQFEGLTIN